MKPLENTKVTGIKKNPRIHLSSGRHITGYKEKASSRKKHYQERDKVYLQDEWDNWFPWEN